MEIFKNAFCILFAGFFVMSCDENKKNNETLNSPEPIDYDGNTSLYCKDGLTMYSVFLKNGLIIDQKTAQINGECVDVVPQTTFLCKKTGDKYSLKAGFKGKVDDNGSLGDYPTSEICEGYLNALKSKRSN